MASTSFCALFSSTSRPSGGARIAFRSSRSKDDGDDDAAAAAVDDDDDCGLGSLEAILPYLE